MYIYLYFKYRKEINIFQECLRNTGGDDQARVYKKQSHYTGNLSAWQSH